MVAMSTRTNALDSFGTASPTRTDPYEAMSAAKGLFGLKKVSLSDWSGKPANPDLFCVVREDTDTVIGQVGRNYECFPNERFFGPVAKALVETTGAHIERFQMLDNGTRSFMRLGWDSSHDIVVGPRKVGDIVGKRCLISTSHDGKFAGKFCLQMLRLTCSNGQTVPVSPFEMALTHTKGGATQLVDLQNLVPLINTYTTKFKVAAEVLAETKITPQSEKCAQIIEKIVDPQKTAKPTKKGEPNRAANRVSRLLSLFDGGQPGSENVAIKGTGWGLYQAAVDFYTHEKGTRGEDEQVQRFRSLVPGSGAAARDIMRSWDVIVDGLGIRPQLEEVLA